MQPRFTLKLCRSVRPLCLCCRLTARALEGFFSLPSFHPYPPDCQWQFCLSSNQSWVEDPSNQRMDFARNHVRLLLQQQQQQEDQLQQQQLQQQPYQQHGEIISR